MPGHEAQILSSAAALGVHNCVPQGFKITDIDGACKFLQGKKDCQNQQYSASQCAPNVRLHVFCASRLVNVTVLCAYISVLPDNSVQATFSLGLRERQKCGKQMTFDQIWELWT